MRCTILLGALLKSIRELCKSHFLSLLCMVPTFELYFRAVGVYFLVVSFLCADGMTQCRFWLILSKYFCGLLGVSKREYFELTPMSRGVGRAYVQSAWRFWSDAPEAPWYCVVSRRPTGYVKTPRGTWEIVRPVPSQRGCSFDARLRHLVFSHSVLVTASKPYNV